MICSMLTACCLLLSVLVLVAVAVPVVAAFCWSLDTLLLVTFGYFGYGYGNSNSKILLFVWGMNNHRYHVQGKAIENFFKVREMTRLVGKMWSMGTMGTRRD